MNIPEIIVEILKKVNPEDLPRVCQTNKLFSDICNDPDHQKAIVTEKIPRIVKRIQLLGLDFPINFKFYILAERYYQYLTDDELRLFYLLDNGLPLDKWQLSPKYTGNYTIIKSFILAPNSWMNPDGNTALLTTSGSLVRTEVIIRNKANKSEESGKIEKKGISYPFNAKYYIDEAFKMYIISIYLSIHYRSKRMINFLNVNGWESSTDNIYGSNLIFFERVEHSLYEIQVVQYMIKNFEFWLVQYLCVLLTVHESGILYSKLFSRDMLFLKKINNGYKWRNQELNKADFWAYKIGTMILYFIPSEYILKFIPDSSVLKISYPIIYGDFHPKHDLTGVWPLTNLTEKGAKIDFYALDRSLIAINDIISILPDIPDRKSLIEKFTSIFDRHSTQYSKFQMSTIRMALRSPVLFGKYMYPPALTPTSKVIILGEI